MNKLRGYLMLVLGLLLLAACGGTSSFSLGGTFSGLGEGKGISLAESVSGQSVVAVEDGSFVFAQNFNSGASYKVEIGINPAAQGCVVKNGEGVIANANVVNVEVTCGDSGSLDESFAVGGTLIKPMWSPTVELVDAAILDDGLLMLGQYYDTAESTSNLAVIRTDADGAFDSDYAAGGIAQINLGGYEDAVQILPLSDGGALLVARSQRDFSLARITPAGELDATFGSGGVVLTDFDGDFDVPVAAFTLEGGGYLVVGRAVVGGTPSLGMARYTASGALDTAFGSGGKVSASYPAGSGYVYVTDAVRQPDGKIVVLGEVDLTGSNENIVLVRFNADGSIDTGFGSNGWAMADNDGDDDHGVGLALQPDGGIVVVARYYDGSRDLGEIVRFTSSGDVDASFGIGGFVVQDTDTDRNTFEAVAIQEDGKIVIAGRNWVSGADNLYLLRYLPNGQPDDDFGTRGLSSISSDSGGDYYPTAVLIQPDGRILVLGGERSSALLAVRFWH